MRWQGGEIFNYEGHFFQAQSSLMNTNILDMEPTDPLG